MASKFYFISKGQDFKIYELDCTTEATIEELAMATTRSTENNADLTSHYRLLPRSVSYNGLITNIKSYESDSVNINEWLDEIRTLRKTTPTPTWTVFTNGQVVPNCLITNLTVNTDHVIGDQAWGVNINFQEIRFVDQAKLTVVAEPQEASKKDVSGKTSKNSNTTKSYEREVIRTGALYGLDALILPLTGGITGT